MIFSAKDMIRQRKSVRTFDGRPLSDADRNKLEDYINTLTNPFAVPVEFRLLDAKEHNLSSPVIVGENTYLTAKVKLEGNYEIAYGYSFEKACLYAMSLDEINEKTADTMENDARLKELQEAYGIDPDSEENNELSKLAFKVNNSKDGLSEEENSKMSEYQQQALYYVAKNQQNSLDIDRAKSLQAANVQGYSDMKSERNKSQEMLNAQDAAEEIMDAANGEAITLLTQEAVEHVDEEQKEREEEVKESAEKKKEEKKEEAKKLEKEAMQQEMIENIKEHAIETQRTSADTKRAIARRERAEADSMGAEDAQKIIISEDTSMEDTQNTVNSEITNILNKLSLLSNDVKGSTVDSQI